ncbi:hypothetical protein Hden_1537 [Hyphomicrobium denitrificans ATCC 51888]|uniref:Uncharacterized protein n=1 Tax=Hyphomicrobium denitrificans (strain ATCC 51888 / DSM 1869 / NCIMB 11706 / TK 0415) TaxID=582899 RepID=D8JQ23_HYPDA|nr:hypothetical protein [Hyphomicrobium denitrificans]ADJ21944.1 hypothetical protein Hden_0117 [Hyphomicrobium denitrificans ATCC 51888]ADJ23349.1 hypothetical protein Hden_1537 [Hyphomicrobium denitrificans ATCC 51888]
MENANNTAYDLVVSFSGLYGTMPEEHAFVHGCEFGQLWQRMTSGSEAEIEGTFHSANRVVIERACVSQGWSAEFEDAKDDDGKSYDEWLFVKLKKVKSASHNPHGLRVVASERWGS